MMYSHAASLWQTDEGDWFANGGDEWEHVEASVAEAAATDFYAYEFEFDEESGMYYSHAIALWRDTHDPTRWYTTGSGGGWITVRNSVAVSMLQHR